MAVATEELNISISADIRDLKRKLAEIPDVTKREASLMVKGIRDQYKKAERSVVHYSDLQIREAKKAAREVQRAQAEMFDGLSKAGKTFEGQLGGAVSVVEDFMDGIKGISGVAGPLAGSMAAVGAAVTAGGFAMSAAGYAAVEFARGAVEAGDRLREMGKLSADGQLAVSGLSTSLDSVSLATDTAMVAFAEAAPELRLFLDAVSGGIKIVADFVAASREMRDSVSIVGRVAAGIGTLGLSELALKGMRVAAEEGRELNAVVEEYGLTQDDVFVGPEAPAGIQKTTRAIRDQKAAVKDLNIDVTGLAGAFRTFAEEALAAMDAAWDAYWEDVATSLREAGVAAEEAAASVAQITRRDIWEGVAASIMASTQAFQELSGFAAQSLLDLGGLIEDTHARKMDQLATEREGEREAYAAQRERVKAKLEAGKIDESQARSRLDQIRADREATRGAFQEQRDQQKKAALRGFRMTQAAQYTQAAIDAARAAVALLPAFSFAGPAAPGLAGAAAAGSFAIAAAKIKGAQPPQFTRGGSVGERMSSSPDHTIIAARATEGIVSDRGMARIGGAAGLRALNDGGSMAGQTVVVQMDGRMLGAATAAVMATDSGVGATLDRRSGTLPGIRTIRGG